MIQLDAVNCFAAGLISVGLLKAKERGAFEVWLSYAILIMNNFDTGHSMWRPIYSSEGALAGDLAEEFFFQLVGPALVCLGLSCQVADVCTLQHHLHSLQDVFLMNKKACMPALLLAEPQSPGRFLNSRQVRVSP